MSLVIFKEHEASFPIRNIANVVAVFRKELAKNEPDLLLLSLVVGVIENTMTQVKPCVRLMDVVSTEFYMDSDKILLPDVDLHVVKTLYEKFYSIVQSNVDLANFQEGFASRELVEKVSDVILNNLTKRYNKDKAHLQSIYSYLTG